MPQYQHDQNTREYRGSEEPRDSGGHGSSGSEPIEREIERGETVPKETSPGPQVHQSYETRQPVFHQQDYRPESSDEAVYPNQRSGSHRYNAQQSDQSYDHTDQRYQNKAEWQQYENERTRHSNALSEQEQERIAGIVTRDVLQELNRRPYIAGTRLGASTGPIAIDSERIKREVELELQKRAFARQSNASSIHDYTWDNRYANINESVLKHQIEREILDELDMMRSYQHGYGPGIQNVSRQNRSSNTQRNDTGSASNTSGFWIGAGIAVLALLASPNAIQSLRSTAVKTTQQAINFSDKVSTFLSKTREDVEDMLAEAKYNRNQNTNPFFM